MYKGFIDIAHVSLALIVIVAFVRIVTELISLEIIALHRSRREKVSNLRKGRFMVIKLR